LFCFWILIELDILLNESVALSLMNIGLRLLKGFHRIMLPWLELYILKKKFYIVD